MPSISYDEINSKTYSKAKMYDFLDLTELQVNEFMCSWIHSAYTKPYVRKLFSSISLDDEIRTITYEMKYSVDDEYDRDFVIDIFGMGVLIEWLSPKINSIENIAQAFGSSEEKWYSQSNHLKELRSLRDGTIKEQRSLISDRGYFWNSYLGGE